MRRRPKPLPCRSVILNEDQRRLGPLKRASRVKSDTRAQALRPAAWWNGRHSRLKICFWETGVPVRVRSRPPNNVLFQIVTLPKTRLNSAMLECLA
jgi:hypothetical protein